MRQQFRPGLLIVTSRPEFQGPWIGRPHVTALTLSRLAEREVGAMIDGILGNELLPANVRQDIVERTDGIPLFVEEMTKALLEAGGESAATQMAAAVPSPAMAVPASLHASLMARLDRLGPAKEVAQIGAAIGREFSHALLASVVHTEPELNSALDRLIAAGLLFRQGVPRRGDLVFCRRCDQTIQGSLDRSSGHPRTKKVARQPDVRVRFSGISLAALIASKSRLGPNKRQSVGPPPVTHRAAARVRQFPQFPQAAPGLPLTCQRADQRLKNGLGVACLAPATPP
jgi:hypothetical protein